MPRRTRQEDPPSAMDHLDPAPRERRQPAPPKPPRRVIGAVERAARDDLKNFPEKARKGVVAALMIRLAREADDSAGSASMRDLAAVAGQARQCYLTLQESFPAENQGDANDALRKRREGRLLRAVSDG